MAGGGETRRFTMKADGWLFRNLMGGLYSDKIGSTLREIVSNAVDAHAMAKTPEAVVKVQLPSAFDPTFSVRDFGPGMDEEFVMDLYTCVGHSEKRGTNSATGMFGLGSKSPFAISDSFEVWTYQDGVRTQYNTYYDVDGTPAIKIMGRYQTDEPNGTLVRVPVSNDNIRAFEEALHKNSFAYYDKNIEFSRKLNGHAEETMAVIKRSVVEFVPGLFQLVVGETDSRGRSYRGGMFIRQGTAIYPLEENQLGYDAYTSDRRKIMVMLQKDDSAVLFDVPIGTLSVTPSREAISYDAPTIRNLKELFTKCADAAGEKLAQIIGDARTYRQAYVRVLASYPEAVRTDLKTWHLCKDIVKFGEPAIRRNHKAWVDANNFDPAEHILTQSLEFTPAFFGPTLSVQMYAGDAYMDWSSKMRGNVDKSQRWSSTIPCLAFVIPHATRNWEQRIFAWIKEHSPVTLRANDGMSLHFLVVRAKQADADLVAAKLRDTGMFEGVQSDASQLPEITVEEANNDQIVAKRKRYSKNAVYVWQGAGWGDGKIEVDFSEPAYYVIRNGAHHDNLFMLDDEKKAFIAAKHWADITAHSTTQEGKDFAAKGLCPRSNVSNSMIPAILKVGETLKLIDSKLPIYRLTPLQAGRLLDMEDHELSPLFLSTVESMLKLKDEFVSAAVDAAYDVDGSYSLTGYVDGQVQKLVRKNSLSEHKLSFIDKVLSDDTFALGLVMYVRRMAVRDTNSVLPPEMRAEMVRGAAVTKAVQDFFTFVPVDSLPGVVAAEKATDVIKARFALLRGTRIDENMMRHYNLYVNGVLADTTGETADLTPFASLVPFIHMFRKIVKDAILTMAAQTA